jgi:hypothetical protein
MTTITDELKRKWDRPSPEASPVFDYSRITVAEPALGRCTSYR